MDDDDKKMPFKTFGCRDMKKSFSVLALEELFGSEDDKPKNQNHHRLDVFGGSDQAFIHLPFENSDILDKFYIPAPTKNPVGEDKSPAAGSSDEESSNPIDLEHAKRKVSNRESARRSRKRKQAHLEELEVQVEKLQGENAALFKQLGIASHQFKEATTNHRVFKSNVEALKAKVKLAEDMVTRDSLNLHLVQNYLNTTPQQYIDHVHGVPQRPKYLIAIDDDELGMIYDNLDVTGL